MVKECEHKNLVLFYWESTRQDYDIGTGWDGETEELEDYYINGGICINCDKVLTVQEIKDLTGLSVYKAEFTEI